MIPFPGLHPELVCVDPLGQMATPRSWLRHLGNGASFVPVDATDEASVKTTVPKPSRPAEAVARFRNDLPLAAEHYQRAVTIFESIGVPFDAAIALTNLGIVARDAGKLAEASSAFARAVAVSERIHYPYLLIGAKVNWAAAEALAGNRAKAATLLDESLTELDATGFVDPDYALPLELIGAATATAGDTAQAALLLERARDMWAELKRETDVARTQQLLDSLG